MLTIIRQNAEGPSHCDAAVIPALLSERVTFWLDLETPTDDEFSLLEKAFKFHPIAIEDAQRPHQRPKVDQYDTYFFMTADEIAFTPADGQPAESAGRGVALHAGHRDAIVAAGLQVDENPAPDVQRRQLAMFVGPQYLVTVQTATVETVRDLRNRVDHSRRLLDRGADYLLYTLLDMLVDRYFPILDRLEDRMDEIEDRIVEQPDPSILQTIFAYKRNLTTLRRFAGPLREAIQTLTTREFPNIRTSTLPYLRDVADHLFRIYEMLDSYRDLTSNMLDAYLSQVSNQMNRVMQRLAVVGTVFLPITFLTGVFGMNFADQPWLRTNFWLWMGLMAITAGATLVWFHRRRLV